MRLIDADALIEDLDTVNPVYDKKIKWAKSVVKSAPTVDIVTYCMIYECEDCPRYGDDCDGRDEE